jgi:hypothetical protein
LILGHFAVALAAKRAAPRASLGQLVAASLLPDLVFICLVLAGVETYRLAPDLASGSPLLFVNAAISHSLLGILGIAVFVFAVSSALKLPTGTRIVLSGLVLSHWFLDFAFHTNDLAVSPWGTSRVGLGLWEHRDAIFWVEPVLLYLGFCVYSWTTKPRSANASIALGAFVFWLFFTFSTKFAMPAPSMSTLIPSGLGLVALSGWAQALDMGREIRPSAEATVERLLRNSTPGVLGLVISGFLVAVFVYEVPQAIEVDARPSWLWCSADSMHGHGWGDGPMVPGLRGKMTGGGRLILAVDSLSAAGSHITLDQGGHDGILKSFRGRQTVRVGPRTRGSLLMLYLYVGDRAEQRGMVFQDLRDRKSLPTPKGLTEAGGADWPVSFFLPRRTQLTMKCVRPDVGENGINVFSPDFLLTEPDALDLGEVGEGVDADSAKSVVLDFRSPTRPGQESPSMELFPPRLGIEVMDGLVEVGKYAAKGTIYVVSDSLLHPMSVHLSTARERPFDLAITTTTRRGAAESRLLISGAVRAFSFRTSSGIASFGGGTHTIGKTDRVEGIGKFRIGLRFGRQSKSRLVISGLAESFKINGSEMLKTRWGGLSTGFRQALITSLTVLICTLLAPVLRNRAVGSESP